MQHSKGGGGHCESRRSHSSHGGSDRGWSPCRPVVRGARPPCPLQELPEGVPSWSALRPQQSETRSHTSHTSHVIHGSVWTLSCTVFFQGLSGGTTVSATMIAAHRAGIPVFVTGGIGGVHRDGENSKQTGNVIGNTVVIIIIFLTKTWWQRPWSEMRMPTSHTYSRIQKRPQKGRPTQWWMFSMCKNTKTVMMAASSC